MSLEEKKRKIDFEVQKKGQELQQEQQKKQQVEANVNRIMTDFIALTGKQALINELIEEEKVDGGE
jgi:hypothetical protein